MKFSRLQSQQNFVKTRTLQLLVGGRSFVFWQCRDVNSSLCISWDCIPRWALFKIVVFFRHEESNFIIKILIDMLVVCDGRRQTKCQNNSFFLKSFMKTDFWSKRLKTQYLMASNQIYHLKLSSHQNGKEKKLFNLTLNFPFVSDVFTCRTGKGNYRWWVLQLWPLPRGLWSHYTCLSSMYPCLQSMRHKGWSALRLFDWQCSALYA